MFCSHCGKSVLPEDVVCPHCGAEIGEERFTGNMYTSTQPRLAIDELDKVPAGSLSAFTRTGYMSYDNQPKDDVYSNTSYRPSYTGGGEPADEPYADEPAPRDEGGQDDDQGYDRGYDQDYDQAGGREAPLDEPEAEEPEPAPQPEPPVRPEEPAKTRRPDPDDEGAGETVTRKARTAARRAQESLSRVADETLEAYDEDDDSPSTSPLPDIGPRGINDKVRGYMQARQNRAAQQEEKAQRGGGLRDRLLSLGRKKPAEPEGEDEYAEEPADLPAEDETAYEPVQPASPDEADYGEPEEDLTDDEPAEEGGAVSDEDYDDESESDDDEKAPLAGAMAWLRKKAHDRRVQIGLASVLVVLVLVLGIRWLIYITSSLGTKIAGVTRSTYSEGIKLIDEYTTDAYRDNYVSTASINEGYAQQLMDADYAKLEALLPAEPQENDDLFVNTLTTIHKSVQNVILRDADAQYNNTMDARQADSDREWTIVKNAVGTLKEATAASQLNALSSDVQAGVMPTEAPTPAPTSTPEPTYKTLREGMNDSADVQALQARLIQLGYLTGKADGDYGPKTSAAVRAFQTEAGLTADGVASAETQEALYAEDAPEAPTPAETPVPEDAGDDEAAQAIFDVVSL